MLSVRSIATGDHPWVYQWKAGRATRTLRGIDAQIAKADAQVSGKAPVKRNRFITLDGATKTINRDLEAKARALAGFKAYLSNIPDPTPEKVIGAYQNLYKIEKTFRMAKSDLAVRPVYHRLRESIDAHLTIVFAAMAVSHWIETTTGWSIKKFVTTTRQYRTTWAKVGTQILPVRKPLPDDLREALDKINHTARAGDTTMS